ncbi:hypothetical protein [Burkholderia sp. GbtcB21]|uniref:hypothetical protein n=1 Tax=Burkholderia sp. GbtcB21 TaxID=2824766 RepID=UPI001C2FE883|nr:hypothetical protein [Burkholderia sp. GbtcB21]
MNCKPGDLAIVIASGFPSNIGRIVEVLRPCPSCELIDPLVPEWECRMLSPMEGALWFEADGIDPIQDEIDIEDRQLRPVSGLPITEDIDTEILA